MPVPGLTTSAKTSPSHRRTDQGLVLSPAVVLDSGNTDSGSSPTSMFRAGNVIVLRTSTGRYVEANDANGDSNGVATITSSGHSDGNGAIALSLKGGTVISVTTTTGSGTEANHATDLNAAEEFAALFVASSAGGELTITSRAAGADVYFHMDSTTLATAGFAEGAANGVNGTDAEYLVTEGTVSLIDSGGTAAHAECEASWAGDYVSGNLTNLSAEAKAVLLRRGSRIG